jgi:hypothetical protein
MRPRGFGGDSDAQANRACATSAINVQCGPKHRVPFADAYRFNAGSQLQFRGNRNSGDPAPFTS